MCWDIEHTANCCPFERVWRDLRWTREGNSLGSRSSFSTPMLPTKCVGHRTEGYTINILMTTLHLITPMLWCWPTLGVHHRHGPVSKIWKSNTERRAPLWVFPIVRTPNSPLLSTRASVRAFSICLERSTLRGIFFFAAICLEKVDLVWYNCDLATASSSIDASLSYRLKVHFMFVCSNGLRLWNTSQRHECNAALVVQCIV